MPKFVSTQIFMQFLVLSHYGVNQNNTYTNPSSNKKMDHIKLFKNFIRLVQKIEK
jgi:hypothetical protein